MFFCAQFGPDVQVREMSGVSFYCKDTVKTNSAHISARISPGISAGISTGISALISAHMSAHQNFGPSVWPEIWPSTWTEISVHRRRPKCRSIGVGRISIQLWGLYPVPWLIAISTCFCQVFVGFFRSMCRVHTCGPGSGFGHIQMPGAICSGPNWWRIIQCKMCGLLVFCHCGATCIA